MGDLLAAALLLIVGRKDSFPKIQRKRSHAPGYYHSAVATATLFIEMLEPVMGVFQIRLHPVL